MAIGVYVGASLEQLLDHVIVSHLRRDPQRSGAIRAPGVGYRSLRQQEHEYLEVAVLSRDEQGRGAVLSAHPHTLLIMTHSGTKCFLLGTLRSVLTKNMKIFKMSQRFCLAS